MHTYSAGFFFVAVVGLPPPSLSLSLSLALSLSTSLIVCQSSAVVQHSWEETRRFYLPVSGSSSQPTQIKEKRVREGGGRESAQRRAYAFNRIASDFTARRAIAGTAIDETA